MTNVLLLGAGRIGRAIAHLLGNCPEYRVTAIDRDRASLDLIAESRVERLQADVVDAEILNGLLARADVVLNAGPYTLSEQVAGAAVKHNVHYLDLTEDTHATKRIQELGRRASCVMMPQCGLAPGFVAIAARAVAQRLERVDSLCARVGALPVNPSNELKYNLTWSTSGLVNEYCNGCDVIVNGELRTVPALEGHEEFCLDGVTYEAFYTSGGLGTLGQTLDGALSDLSYKTIRYPGHRALINFLANDLRLRDRRDVFESILEHGVPCTADDVVIVFVTATGLRDGRLTRETFCSKVYASSVSGQTLSAIQVTTAASACAMLDFLVQGRLPSRGFVTQESIGLDEFMKNRFGRYYAPLPM
jgi:saccharopine dehydrogenase-like NADP-dependent oxidoreductase